MPPKFLRYMLVGCSLLAGCGYQLAGHVGDSRLVAGKRIAIPVFASKSYRPNLEAVLTASLVDEAARRSGGLVVGESEAELLLTGTILSYNTLPVSYSAADTVRTYRTTIVVEAVLMEKGSRKTLWKGVESQSQDYPANPAIALQQNSEEAAIREVCRKLAEQLYQKITQDF